MKKWSGKGRSWMVTMPLAAGAVAYVMLVFLPAQRRIGDVRDELNTKRQFIANTQLLAPTVVVAQEQLVGVEKHNQKWRTRLAAQAGLPALFARINLAARAAGARTRRFEPQKPMGYATLSRQPVTMAIEGSFASVSDFLTRLEAMREVIWINHMRIEPSGQSGERLGCEFDLAILAARSGKSD